MRIAAAEILQRTDTFDTIPGTPYPLHAIAEWRPAGSIG